MKTALITGITGQDGSYLCEYLLEQNYKVVGLYRRSSSNILSRIAHINSKNLTLEEFDITEPNFCSHIIDTFKPDELYNLAAQSHVGTSFKQPVLTTQINTIGVLNLLEAIKKYSPKTKFYQASSSEMFGLGYQIKDDTKYQNENTPFLPQSPYGTSKLASHNIVRIYRTAYNIFACCGILFNHESPRRGENFVTKKITKYIGNVKKGLTTEKLKLGNLSAQKDWGYAKDYIKSMHIMLQSDSPDDYVVCTGETQSVEKFLKQAFEYAGLDIDQYVEIDKKLFRPAEVNYVRGDGSKIKNKLGWQPQTNFQELVKIMVDYELQKF